ETRGMNTLDTLAIYLARVAPGLILGAGVLFLARRAAPARIGIYLALFILTRDVMTPLGLWSFGTQGFFWIRLYDDPAFLVVFGVACLGLSLLLYWLDTENRPLIQWTRGGIAAGFLRGLIGAGIAVAPLAALYRYTPIETRGGSVPLQSIPAI